MPAMTKQQAQKFLENVPEEYVFYFVDGRTAWNLEDLLNAIANITDDTFAHHCTPDKNDFANWVADVIGDQKLAGDLIKAKIRAKSMAAVSSRIAFLRSKIG